MEDCIHVLGTQKRGVLSVNGDDGYPYGMPMNHFYNEEDGKIEIVSNMDEIVEITRRLSYKFTQDDAYIEDEIAKHAHRTRLLVLTPEHICGKLVEES